MQPADVEKLTVRTYAEAHAICANSSPQTTYQAKFSIPYCAAVALRFGRAGDQEFAQDRVEDAVRRLHRAFGLEASTKGEN